MANQTVSGHVTLIKRKRGEKWYAKYRLRDGRQRFRLLGPAWRERSRPPAGYLTRKTAEAELEAILTDARRGELPDLAPASGRTLGEAVEAWLAYVRDEKGRRPSTVRDYRNTANGALLAEFGRETPIEEIGTERIDAYRRRLLSGGGVSRRTVQKQMVLMHGILKRAKSLGWIPSNPMDEVERVNVAAAGEFNVLSAAQVEAVANNAEAQFSAAIIVAAYTGLRTGELRALRWRDVNFSGSAIRVQRNRPVGGGEGAPKSGKARSVPLMDDAARELDRLSRREEFVGGDELVFCDEAGGALADDVLRKALYEAMEDAGIDRKSFPAREGFTFHDLRHTFGTMAAQVWPLVDVQAYMGHADIQTTMRYLHHVPRGDAAARFTEFVRREKAVATEPKTISRTVSRTAEISGDFSAVSGTEYEAADLSSTHRP